MLLTWEWLCENTPHLFTVFIDNFLSRENNGCFPEITSSLLKNTRTHTQLPWVQSLKSSMQYISSSVKFQSGSCSVDVKTITFTEDIYGAGHVLLIPTILCYINIKPNHTVWHMEWFTSSFIINNINVPCIASDHKLVEEFPPQITHPYFAMIYFAVRWEMLISWNAKDRLMIFEHGLTLEKWG